MVFAKVIQPNY